MSTTTPGAWRRPGRPVWPGRRVMQQAGGSEPAIEAGQLAAHGRRQKGQVRNALQVLGDRPEIMLRRHPVQPVEPGQVDRTAVAAERALPGEVVVMLEVRHGELAEGTVDGLTVSQPGELTGAYGAPQAPPPEYGDHVVLVADRRQVHDQRRGALHPQRGGRPPGTPHANCGRGPPPPA